MVCNFSCLIWPHGSTPAALASLLFVPPEPQIIGKTQRFVTFYLFAQLDLRSSIFFLLFFFLLPSSFLLLFFSSSLLLFFSSSLLLFFSSLLLFFSSSLLLFFSSSLLLFFSSSLLLFHSLPFSSLPLPLPPLPLPLPSPSLLFSSLTLPISAFHLSILSEVWLLNFLRRYTRKQITCILLLHLYLSPHFYMSTTSWWRVGAAGGTHPAGRPTVDLHLPVAEATLYATAGAAFVTSQVASWVVGGLGSLWIPGATRFTRCLNLLESVSV